MSEHTDANESKPDDRELLEVVRNHGTSRRVLMKVLGIGAVGAALGGSATGQEGRLRRIDDVFGAPYSSHERVPGGVVDHVVDVDTLLPAGVGPGGEGDGAADEEVHGDDDGEGGREDDDGEGGHEDDEDEHGDGGQGVHDGFPDPDDEVPEFVFDPVGLHVTPGSVVEFRNVSFEHTVTAFHRKWSTPELAFPTRVPDGVPGFTSPPYVGGESWLYRFTRKGVYDVLCFPHLAFGMVMRIVVFDPEEDSLDESTFDAWGPFSELAEPEQPFHNPNRVLTAESLDPATIVDRGEVAWADLSL